MSLKASFETKRKDPKFEARNKFAAWRLVLDGGMDYNTVFYQMSPDEINEGNAALNRLIEIKNKAMKRK